MSERPTAGDNLRSVSSVIPNHEIPLGDQVQTGREVAELLEHPGFAELEAAFEEAKARSTIVLLNAKPTNEGAEYAARAGEIRGLSRLRAIAEAKVKQGRKAEEKLRVLEEQGEVANG